MILCISVHFSASLGSIILTADLSRYGLWYYREIHSIKTINRNCCHHLAAKISATLHLLWDSHISSSGHIMLSGMSSRSIDMLIGRMLARELDLIYTGRLCTEKILISSAVAWLLSQSLPPSSTRGHGDAAIPSRVASSSTIGRMCNFHTSN